MFAMLENTGLGSFRAEPAGFFFYENSLMEWVILFASVNNTLCNRICLYMLHFFEYALPVIVWTEPAGNRAGTLDAQEKH